MSIRVDLVKCDRCGERTPPEKTQLIRLRVPGKATDLSPEQVAAIAQFCPKKRQDHGEGEGTTIAAEPAGASAAHPIVASSGAPTPSPSRAPQCTIPVQTAPRPDDFDDTTPPPRTRPIGDPVKRYVKLQPGESPIAKFWEWDRAGRIPVGSVLCECVFTDFGRNSGLVVAASCWPPPLGEPGELIATEKLEGWYGRVSIDQRGAAKHVVMSREVA